MLRHVARTIAQPPVNAFESAEEAWFWFVRCQQVRREGAQLAGGGMFSRPCDPDDIYRAIMSLRRRGFVGPMHLTVLARFGLVGRPPDRRCTDEAKAAQLWGEALDRLDAVLRDKGIID